GVEDGTSVGPNGEVCVPHLVELALGIEEHAAKQVGPLFPRPGWCKGRLRVRLALVPGALKSDVLGAEPIVQEQTGPGAYHQRFTGCRRSQAKEKRSRVGSGQAVQG